MSPFDLTRALQQARSEHAHFLDRLIEYLKIPSISADPSQSEAMQQCAQMSAELLSWAGLEQVEILPLYDAPPYVVGRWSGRPGAPTMLVYGHYDVQPATPLELWTTPPFEPDLRDERLFARGATDDKGQALMHLCAIRSILRSGGELPFNLIVLLEGEEEIVSPNLERFISQYGEKVRADLWMLSDTAMWDVGRPAITTSLRGMALMEVHAQCAARDLHSGTFGGAVANPLEALSRLLAKMKDADGHVLIPGFYDEVDPVNEATRAQLASVPLDPDHWYQEIGIARGGEYGEQDFSLLERLWMRPTLEINGLWGGHNGAGIKTVLPAKAQAKLSMRLVPHQDPAQMIQRVSQFLTREAPDYLQLEINPLPGSGRGIRVAADHPALRPLRMGLEEAFGDPPLLLGEGATIPVVARLSEAFDMPPLLVGFALPDSRCHAPDENMHMPTFYTGIEALIRAYNHFGEIQE
uniref:Putative Peptidase M20 n=1 Tax=Magnetococcus massalia (strain MO-1) TaxID=451514 RepID=A0A1S7LG87_MAGMO|nr:putative Peptidase M20 [Candidatus Magnetococcus massalia]